MPNKIVEHTRTRILIFLIAFSGFIKENFLVSHLGNFFSLISATLRSLYFFQFSALVKNAILTDARVRASVFWHIPPLLHFSIPESPKLYTY